MNILKPGYAHISRKLMITVVYIVDAVVGWMRARLIQVLLHTGVSHRRL